MSIKFDSKEVKAFFQETCKLGGSKKEIDTAIERNKLSEYLANNKDNMSVGDIATFNTYLKPPAQNAPTQPKDVEVNVYGENNNVQVAVGNNNEQHINVYYGTKPVEGKASKETPVQKAPVKKDKLVENDTPNKKKSLESSSTTDKPKTGDKKLDLTGTYFDDSGKMRSKDGRLYRYGFGVNLQPSPDVKKDLKYIKRKISKNLSQIRGYKRILDQINSMNSIEEIQRCLKDHGIEMHITY